MSFSKADIPCIGQGILLTHFLTSVQIDTNDTISFLYVSIILHTNRIPDGIL